MNELFFFVKTRSIDTDRRVQKELKCLSKNFDKINLIYAANDNISDDKFFTRKVNILGGGAPKNALIRFFGALQFCIFSFFYLLFKRKRKNMIWVCDPVLFPLVLLLSKLKYQVVWDHHELPPAWVLKSKVVTFLFKIAYSSSFASIHCNQSRKLYLESMLNFSHQTSFNMPNYPDEFEMHRKKHVEFPSCFIDKKLVYLQNSMIPQRCGTQVLDALKKCGYKAIHAGSSYNIQDKHNELIHDLGVLSLEEISYCLDSSIFTIVTYKDESLNQKYCEPNRIYHAMARGIFIIAGNNPTIVEILSEYPNKVILKDDGSDVSSIINAIKKIELMEHKKFIYQNYWTPHFEKVMNNVLSKKNGAK